MPDINVFSAQYLSQPNVCIGQLVIYGWDSKIEILWAEAQLVKVHVVMYKEVTFD